MPATTEWKVPPAFQPRPEDYRFDLDRALRSVVGLHSIIPPDAFSAETLGTERAGTGVLIDDGLVLTIGYLITEAATVWLHLGDGRAVEGHALGFDFESGFGLVQVLVHLVYFLHMKTDAEGRWNVVSMIFTVLIIAFVVGLSVWIMWSMHYHMMIN